jgi:parallel beta-helix repeat protein
MVTDQVCGTGPTYISGPITSDTTWYSADSPYIVTGDVTVEPGFTLTIEPGVEVKFDGVYSITVDGKLIADGTFMNKIKFTSNQTMPAKGDWYTVRLRTECNLIDYAEIEYASYGVFMTFFGANNTISNTTINNCKYDGIYLKNSDCNTIHNCTITSNDRFGITIYESHGTKVDNNTIQYNNYFGINLNASTYTQIYDCNISYNDGKGILLYSNSHHTTISDCQIDCNNHVGIDLSGTFDNDIINTTVIGNNGVGIDFGGVTKYQWIKNCTIMDNEGTGIDLRGSSYVDIMGCKVSRNKGYGGIYSDCPVSSINIFETDVLNNFVGNGIDFYEAKLVSITNSNISENAGNGISFNGSVIQENNIIENCTIAENSNNGIYFYAYKSDGNAYLQKNTLYSNTIHSNTQNGIYFYANTHSINVHDYYSCIQNNNIYSNLIYLNNQNGIYFFDFADPDGYSLVQHNNIYLNDIYSNNQNGIYFSAYATGNDYPYIQYNNIYSNNIYSNGQNGIYFYPYGYFFVELYIQHNNIYSNNIYSNNQNGIYFHAYGTSFVWSYIQQNDIYLNNIYSNQNGIYFYAYTDYYESYIQNNTIYSNSISQHSNGSGIYLQADKPATIWQSSDLYNNTITFNQIGIEFLRIKSYIIYSNTVANNNNAISFNNSNSNIFRYNKIMNNIWAGINLTSSSDNNIENNNISFNTQTGIFIANNSNNNLITRNDISINFKVGLNITGSSGNQIHHNNFKWNARNAFDSTIALNDWDDGTEGNCWSDYAGTDDDNDGFGEDPYVIPGGGSRDWHPFMNYLNITAPRIISTSPMKGATNVPVDTNVTIEFSKEMNTTATESAISISEGLIPTNFQWNNGNQIVTFTPSSQLSSETSYIVTITTEAKDVLGNWMEDTYLFSFTSADIEPPKISKTLPFDGETNVEINVDIIVTFNEPMQPSTVTYSCIPDPDGWSVSWSSDNTIATFSHNDFGSEITYTFQIIAGKDTANLDLATGPVPNPWALTTVDVVGPEITSTSPAYDEENVSTTAVIVVDFNEEIDKTSITYTCISDPLGWAIVWANNNKTAIFLHNEFTERTWYSFHVTGAKDLLGNDLNPSAISNPWSFTTTGDYVAPQIILTSPADYAANIDPDANVIVTFSEVMNTSSLNYICIPDPGGWSESWSAGNTVVALSHNPFNSSGTYEFLIIDAQDLVNYNLMAGTIPNPWSFQIADVVSPKILSTSPSNCTENVMQTANVVVKFNEEMNTSSISFICNPNPSNWSVIWSSGNTIATFTHNPFDSMTNYTFHIIDAKDIVGNNLVSDSTPNPWWFITIDSEGPYIISASPVNGASDIEFNNDVIVTFSEQVELSSVTFSCAPDPGGWGISWSAGNTVVTFSHNPFSESTRYTFQITSARDLANNNLAKGTIPNPWTFTTIDPIPPTIINTLPGNGETEVSLDTHIIVIFSEPMNINSVAYICTPDPGGWNMGWSSDNSVALISHNPFAIGTTYTFHVTAGKDLDGNKLISGAVPHSWNFTTISVNSLIVTPSNVNIIIDGTVILIAQAYDLQNNPITDIAYIWSINNNLGTISPQGSQIVSFKASSNVGTCHVNVTAGGKYASVYVTIKSDDIRKDETKDSLPEDMIWISLLWLVIVTACIVIVIVVIWKKGSETEEGKEQIDEDTTSEEIPEVNLEENKELELSSQPLEPLPDEEEIPPPPDD